MYSTIILAVLFLFAVPQQPPSAKWVRDTIPPGIVTGDPQWIGHWECPQNYHASEHGDPPGFGRERVPICLEGPEPLKESPIARSASIYPHPPDPKHLLEIKFDLTFTIETKHWYGQSKEPLEGRIEFAQKRTKDGWYENNHRDTDVNGRIVSTVEIDPTWRNPTVLMLVWKGKDNRPVDSVTIEVPNDELLKGVKREITFNR
jgi:hypothetical protein